MDSLSAGNYIDGDISEHRWSFRGNTIVAHIQQEQSNSNYSIVKIIIIYFAAWCPVEILMFTRASLSSLIPPMEKM